MRESDPPEKIKAKILARVYAYLLSLDPQKSNEPGNCIDVVVPEVENPHSYPMNPRIKRSEQK